MAQQFVESGEVRIWTETFGDPADPALLLVMGAGAQGVRWDERLCRDLAAHRLFVIRYDHRDVGLSTRVDFEARPYTLKDLAQDAVAVLDGLGVAAAHVLGVSMGGMVAQHLALDHRDRVRTLTSVMSSSVSGTGADDETFAGGAATELPGPKPEFMVKAAPLFGPAPDEPGERIARAVEIDALLAGALGFDRAGRQAIAALEEARAPGTDRGENHGRAVTATTPGDRRPRLRRLAIRTLVIHGSDDPIMQIAHGEATAAAIAGARFLRIEGMGHNLPPAAWPRIIQAVVSMIDTAEDRLILKGDA